MDKTTKKEEGISLEKALSMVNLTTREPLTSPNNIAARVRRESRGSGVLGTMAHEAAVVAAELRGAQASVRDEIRRNSYGYGQNPNADRGVRVYGDRRNSSEAVERVFSNAGAGFETIRRESQSPYALDQVPLVGGRRPATVQPHGRNHYNSAGVGAVFNENANVREVVDSSSKPPLLRAKTPSAVAASTVEKGKGAEARVHFSHRSTDLSRMRGNFSNAASSVDYPIDPVGDETLRRLSDEEQKASTVKVQHLVEGGKFSPGKQGAPQSYRDQYGNDTTRSLLGSSDNQRGPLSVSDDALPNVNYVSSATAAANLAAVRGDGKRLAAAAQKQDKTR